MCKVSRNVWAHSDTLVNRKPEKVETFRKSDLVARMLLTDLQDFWNER